jgi:hypothetical protein
MLISRDNIITILIVIMVIENIEADHLIKWAIDIITVKGIIKVVHIINSKSNNIVAEIRGLLKEDPL